MNPYSTSRWFCVCLESMGFGLVIWNDMGANKLFWSDGSFICKYVNAETHI